MPTNNLLRDTVSEREITCWDKCKKIFVIFFFFNSLKQVGSFFSLTHPFFLLTTCLDLVKMYQGTDQSMTWKDNEKVTFILTHGFIWCCLRVSSHLCNPNSCVYVCVVYCSVCFGRQFKPKKTEIVIDFNSINHPGMLNSATKWKCKRLTLGSCWMKRGGRVRLTRLKGTLMPLFCMSSCPLLCPKENSRIPRLWRLLIFWFNWIFKIV